MTGPDLARATEGLIGTPFRLHGRDPAFGLDCIGLLGAALARAGRPVELPTGYTLRLRSLEGWLPHPRSLGFGVAERPFVPGDVVLLAPGPAQFHLAIAAADGAWIHAHAGLRRVVREPGLPAGTLTHHWRLLPNP